ncbi:thiol peroxidase [candidate division KSB1 bacterium]|nr:thiol peroxidase [candidate division KSB1 bacterium]NIR70343.1 thiol peroxidase [candidate division KSB1 bacterium]NIS23113.1 thiol peroxidase [candidate division KSB1 bacterium]NIT69948.1 thiol peroxidase [candidate division KSB1 bacterium]NIU23605.1 thiol peroxidase [candidate division KSB1 bacterium]
MAIERSGAVTLHGKPLTLIGPEIKVGDKAPNFKVLANDMSEVTLYTDKGKVRLLISVGSLDTPVCDTETKRFNKEAVAFPDNVTVYIISCDLPFAQKRWSDNANASNVKTLSDYRDLSFGEAYGTRVKETRLLSRAVFLVNQDDAVRYVEYVPEIVQEPNYEAVLGAVRKLEG